ncbi:cytochrome P450 [Cubamyces sp. BRFM 1775]|nr:cytochrome P450 [Cubamyces sp. BRFM 1775]
MAPLFGSRSKHLPPGPPGLPILGNLTQIPSSDQWVYFYNLSKKYGDVNTLHVLNTTIIVLNSHEAIDALFNKRVERYSAKPPRRMANLSDLTMTLPFMDPGEDFSTARKEFHTEIGQAGVPAYNAEYEASSRRFLQTLAADLECKDLTKVIDDSIGRAFLKVSTGYEPTPSDTILAQMNNLAHFAADVLGDKFQKLDVLPFLCSLPTWAPVAGPLLKLGAKWKTQLHTTADATVQLAQAGKAAGNDSVMFNLGAAAGEKAMDDRTKMVAVTMNAGGMLATESATLTFLLAMARFPEIQKKAQAEVDALTGGKRLPTMADRPSLPYVDAVLSEVLRWVSIAPVIAREVTEDDEYKGYHIPKGATIMANNWAISRDESIFPEPEVFRPERFLDTSTSPATLRKDILHPMAFAFGFGHRTCPGRYLADALLFSHLAHILAAFDVALPPAAEKDGKAQCTADAQMKVVSNGAACRVQEVYVRLKSRSEAAAELVRLGAGAAPQENGSASGNESGSAKVNGSPAVPNGVANGAASSAH